MAYPVYRDSMISSQLAVNGKTFAIYEDYQPILQLNRSGSQYFSELVFVGHGIVDSAYDDYGNMDVKGKAVLILDGAPSTYKSNKRGFMAPGGLYGKYMAASKKGAAAVIIVGAGFPRKEMAALGNMYNELYKAEQTPSIYTISAKVAEAIMGAEYNTLAQNGKSGKVPAKLVTANVLLELNKKVMILQSSNVLGYIEGTDKKDEWLIITAHYDHLGKRGDVIYYGADDDGSGTVSVMEMAEAFAKAKAAGNGPRRSI